MSLGDDLLALDDLPREEFEAPEWARALNGRKLFIRMLTGTERDAFEAENLLRKGESYQTNFQNMRARLVSKCLVDEAGALVIPDPEKLGRKNQDVLDRAFVQAQRLNKLRNEDVEETEKNSEVGPSADSGSS
jgi:hypothetical protein